MLLLIFCILANVCLGVFFKLFSRYGVDNHGAIIVNYLTCVLIAFLLLGRSPIPLDILDVKWFPYALFLAVLFIFGFNVMALTFQKFNIAFTTIIQKMSIIISVSFALIAYHEPLGTVKLAGLILALAAILLVNYRKGMFRNPTLRIRQNKYLALPIMIFIMSGMIESLLYYVNVESIVENGDIRFVASSFGFAAVIGFFYMMLPRNRKIHRIGIREMVAGFALGVPNFFTIYLLILLLHHGWEGSVLFPLNNIGILIFSALAGIALFSERLNILNTVGLIFSILSIVLIAIS